MTHEYTLLIGAVVLPGGGEPETEAIAWAFDTVLAIGSEAEVCAISRSDSHVITLAGAFVVPLGGVGEAAVGWPMDARLESGGPADFAVLDSDPRAASSSTIAPPRTIAVVRGGHVVDGSLPEADH